MFQLTAHDTTEDFDEAPTSLVDLEVWWRDQQEGRPPYELDLYEGVGFQLTDGDRLLEEVSWGGAAQLAPGCQHVAERLRAGKLALLRSSYLGPSAYVWFVPDGDGQVACGMTTERPPHDVFPFTPSLMPNSPEQIDGLYRWLGERVGSWLASGIRVDVGTVVADLERSAKVAAAVASPTDHVPDLADQPSAVEADSERDATCAPVTLELAHGAVHRIELVRALRELTDEAYGPAKACASQLQAGAEVVVRPTSAHTLERFEQQARVLGISVRRHD